MFFAVYSRLINFSPRFKKLSKYFFYKYLAHSAQMNNWKFMNYGYVFIKDLQEAPQLDPSDEPHRYSIQLYHHLIRAVSLDGHRILDIGCGRGGGLDYLKRYLKAKNVVGLDASEMAMNRCRKAYQAQGLVFIAGDAEALPFSDQRFHAVINVESSHCYADMNKFLLGVKRVLHPGGYFLFADFRDKQHVHLLEEQMERSGMIIIKKFDITDNVITALETSHNQKVAFIQKEAPKYLVRFFKEFAGCRGTRIYNRFKTGKSIYLSYILQKPEGALFP
ncbi:MAG: class I SAM-dependent methyltransferase [Clostridiales bacterium]|nr:class I SAM-dependent methyltransferase [Clostridiales bacterium]